ncbi:MAG: hypothetical protein ABIR39_21730 [Nocardioides sp.]|uniref:hypothetical protein n=1 Tax=Nocardioides sp. TaxID=35761 RepID=UPI0032649063
MWGLGSAGRGALAIVALLALLLLASGAAVAAFVGSDDTVFNRPAELGQDGRPVLTAPDLLAYEGVTVTLRASAPEGVFIGTAHPVDVADFVGDSSRIRLTRVTRTGVEAEDVGSSAAVEPASADFWTASMSGPGVEELTLNRDSSAAQWVIAPLSGVGPTTVSFGITVPGLFRGALIALGTGALVLVISVELLLRSRRRPRRTRRQPPGPPAPSAAERIAAYVPEPDVAPPATEGKHKARRVALAFVLTLSLAGCDYEDLLPAQRQSSELATTKVALTRAELPALFESYGERLRTAVEAARPPRYREDEWHLVDRGPALESDLFGTKVGKLTRLGRRSVPTYEGLEAFSGRFDSYPMWSLVSSKMGRQTRVDLFAKDSVSAPWLREAGSTLSRDLPSPGRPSRLPDADEAAAATAAWRDYLRTGDRDDRLTIDQDSKAWRENIADLGGRAMFSGYTVTVAPAGVSRVVGVADGELAVVALRVTTRLDGRRDLMVRWAPPYGKYRAEKRGVLSFADIAVGVIHLPSKGSPTLLGATFSEVAAP